MPRSRMRNLNTSRHRMLWSFPATQFALETRNHSAYSLVEGCLITMHNLDAALYKWICQANERRDDLGLSPGFIEESIALLKRLLGGEYLEQLLIVDDGPVPVMDEGRHPLRKWLLSAHILQHIVQVMELASYLRVFHDDPALPCKVEKLKRDSFWPMFFELAMATRAKRACREKERVFLNLEVADSVGDFTIGVPGATIPVECSRLGRSLNPSMASPDALLESLSNRISDGVKSIGLRLCVKIRSTAPLNGKTYNDVLRLVRRGLSDVRAQRLPTQHSDSTTMTEFEKLTSSSEEIPFRKVGRSIIGAADTDWPFAARLCWVPAKDNDELTERYKKGEKFYQYEGLRLFVKFAEQVDDADPYTRLETKLRKKLKQTKIKQEHFGKIVMIDVPFDLQAVNENALAGAIRSAALHSKNALSIFLAQRQQTAQIRYGYGYFVRSNAIAVTLRSDVNELLKRIANQELLIDPILGAPYQRTWDEAEAHAERLDEPRESS